MPYTVEEIVEVFERLNRNELAPTKDLEEQVQGMIYELEFRVDFCRIPPGYSSTGLQRVADRMTALLSELRQRQQEYEKERAELEQQEQAKFAATWK
jgi:hypothetical protein